MGKAVAKSLGHQRGSGHAYIAYVKMPPLPGKIAQAAGGLYPFYSTNGISTSYMTVFSCVRQLFGGWLWKRGDKETIDYFGPDGLSALVGRVSARLVHIQTGYVYHYAFAMMIGVVILLSWYFSGFGR